jgi:hypothetical protein
MPLLLNVLRNVDGPDYRKLRVKAMECAGLIGAFFHCLSGSKVYLLAFYPALGFVLDSIDLFSSHLSSSVWSA